MSAPQPTPTEPLRRHRPPAPPSGRRTPTDLALVPDPEACVCMPCVLAVADHHHSCPRFRPA